MGNSAHWRIVHMPNIVLARVEPFSDFLSDMVKIVNTLTLPQLRNFCADYGPKARLPKALRTYPVEYDTESETTHYLSAEALHCRADLDKIQDSNLDRYSISCASIRFQERVNATYVAIMGTIWTRYESLYAGELVSLYGFTRAKRIMWGLERDPRDAEAEAEWYDDAIGRAERRMEFANDCRMAGVDIDWDAFSSL